MELEQGSQLQAGELITRDDQEMIVCGPRAGAVPVGVPSKAGACPWTDSASCVELLCSRRKAQN